MAVTYPAIEYASSHPLLTMERGGFKRFSKDYLVLWYFRTPDSDKIIEIDDFQVPTVDLKPIITIGPWTLDKGEDGRMVWARK